MSIYLFIWSFSTWREIVYLLMSIYLFIWYSRCWKKSHISLRRYLSIYLFSWYISMEREISYLLVSIFIWYFSTLIFIYLSVNLVFLDANIYLFYQVYRHRYLSVYLFLDGDIYLFIRYLAVDIYLFIWYFSTLIFICLSGISVLIFICLSGISRHRWKSHILWLWYLSVYLIFLDIDGNLISFDFDIYLLIWYFSTSMEISYPLTFIFIC